MSEIPSLNGMEHVRRRPGMYFGGINRLALHSLIHELLNNAVEQARAGYCDRIEIALLDNSTVWINDNGKGIPVHLYQDTDKTVLELIVGEIGGKHYESDSYKFRGGMLGVGIAAVNAVSTQFTVQVRRESFLWQQQYGIGVPITPLTKVRALETDEQTGTFIQFTPDFTIFEPNTFSYPELSWKLRETSYLIPGVTIVLEDRRSQPEGEKATFIAADGLADFVSFLNEGYEPLHPVIRACQTLERYQDHNKTGLTFDFEAAFQYTDSPIPLILSFANLWDTGWVGTPVESVLKGLEAFIEHYAHQVNLSQSTPYSFLREDFTNGLTLVINIWHPSLSFGDASSKKLLMPDVVETIYEAIYEALETFGAANAELMKRITKKCLANKQARDKRRFGE